MRGAKVVSASRLQAKGKAKALVVLPVNGGGGQLRRSGAAVAQHALLVHHLRIATDCVTEM